VTFDPGEVSRPLSVPITGETLNEADETFVVNLSNPVNALLLDGQGQCTISNDDPVPTLSVDDVIVNEGDAGTTTATFTVTLSAASGQTVTVDYATAAGTATAPDDYADGTGALTFAPGEISKPVAVTVNGDLGAELDETFFLDLSNPANATIADAQGAGTITNDDGTLGAPGEVITAFALSRIAPNPCRGLARIEFTVPSPAQVRINLLDLQGREVAMIADGPYPPGRHQIAWNGQGTRGAVPAGAYFVRYRTPGKTFTKRLIVAR
jgi:hypothetical protein